MTMDTLMQFRGKSYGVERICPVCHQKFFWNHRAKIYCEICIRETDMTYHVVAREATKIARRMIRKGMACVKCGSHVDLEIHHKVSPRLGGLNDPDNLELLCLKCHRLAHKQQSQGITNYDYYI
jgi:5-methylcytosine-specific restriction endonuclease McrA